MNITKVKDLISHISFEIFGKKLNISAYYDKKYGKRVYLQVSYSAPCTKSGIIEEWKGGKHYLSSYMTEDEVIKRAYVAFESAVKHEIMENFKFDGIIVFNSHINFRKLLEVSQFEVRRSPEPSILE